MRQDAHEQANKRHKRQEREDQGFWLACRASALCVHAPRNHAMYVYVLK